MTSDVGGGTTPASPGASGGRPAYNRPRRYGVQAPVPADATAPADTAAPAGEITHQNPTLAEAAQEHRRRTTDTPPPPGTSPAGPTAPPAPGPAPIPPGTVPYPYPAGPGTGGRPPNIPPTPYPQGGPEHGGPPAAHRRTPPTRVLVVAAAVLVVLAVVGLVIGLSGNDSGTQAGGTPAPGTPASSGSVASSAPTGGGGVPPATVVCANLGSTAPVQSYVTQPRPAERMPVSYVEPQSGTKIAVCVGLLQPGAGTGRGRLGYLAEYEQLSATQYALRLKTLGWTLVPDLPRVTYRNTFRTTVTLVQQGTTLITVVGDGS